MTRLAPLLFALALCGCSRVAMAPTAAAILSPTSKPPGEIVCLNRDLAEFAATRTVLPGNVLVVVYGGVAYGEVVVLPDGVQGRWISFKALLAVLKLRYPDQVFAVLIVEVPVFA